MKIKKTLAAASAIAMSISAVAIAPVQAVGDPATVTLKFDRYEEVGGGVTTFAYVDVYVTIPETLVPYSATEPDWVNSFEYTYSGTTIQGASVDVPYVNGLQFIKAKSTAVDPLFVIDDDTNTKKAKVNFTSTGDASTYYTGSLGKIATLCYRITGDKAAEYTVSADENTTSFGMAKWSGSNATPSLPKYNKAAGNMTFTSATVKPATATTYAVTLGEGVTTTYEGVLTAVPENTEITVTATEKTGFTATLKKDGVAVTSPYKFTVTADTTFTVDYAEIVQENIHKYTLDDKGTCTKDTTKGIYYSLSVKNVANKLAIKVSGKTFEIPANIPEVTGDTKAQLTYVILGVPADMTAAPDLEAVTSGETVFEAE